MVFEHRRSLRKARILELASYLFSMPLFIGFATYLIFILNEPSSILFGKAIFLVIGLVVPFLAWNIIRLSRATGEWNIQVTPREVVWQTPDHLGEKSFRIPIHEISAIVHESSGSNENDNDYYIESTSGTTYPLNLALCGVHIGKFCRALEKMGVNHELRIK